MHRTPTFASPSIRRLAKHHWSIGHAPSRGARAMPASASPVSATILDEKAKAEIRQLHASDPGRWTAAALSARYGAPTENVSAIVRLAALRKGEPSENAASIESAWIELGSRMPGARGRARAPIKRAEIASMAKAEETVQTEEEDEPEVVDLVGTTETARWAKERIAEGEVEVVRKTTYAFIEVGKGIDDRERAVWMRDGRSGKLREPTLEERERVLGQRRV